MKFKFIYKIAVTHEKFLVPFNLLQRSNITCLRPGPVRGLCTPGI